MHRELSDLDSEAILAAEQDAVLAQRQIEIDRMRPLLQWQDRHSADPQAEQGAVPVKYGGDRLTVIGGEGTPGVALLGLEEFAMAGRAGSVATANRLADGLDTASPASGGVGCDRVAPHRSLGRPQGRLAVAPAHQAAGGAGRCRGRSGGR